MSNFENGFILINKSIKLSNVSNSLDYLGLYVYFCLNVQFEDREYILNGQKIKVEKYSMYYSQLSLSQHFGVSLGKINKMIKCLENWGLCENKNDNKKSFIKLKKEYCFFEAGKQNENKMKTKGNKINKGNKLNNIYISDIENYFFNLTGIQENLNDIPDDLDYESFKKSFDNYLLIREDKRTFYNHHFTLNQFVNSPNGFEKFLNASLNDFIMGKYQGEVEYEKTRKKREKLQNDEKEKQRQEEIRLENKINWILQKKNELGDLELDKIRQNIILDFKDKNKLITEGILLSALNIEICKKYNCPY